MDRYSVKLGLYNKDNLSKLYSSKTYKGALDYAVALFKILYYSGIGRIVIMDELTGIETYIDLDGDVVKISPESLACC